MRILEFSVDKQKLVKSGDFSGIVSGSKGYLKCKFNFISEDWTACKVVAVFKHNNEEYAVAVNNDRTCMVPNEVTDGRCFKIKMVGVKGKDYSITTNKVLISQEV